MNNSFLFIGGDRRIIYTAREISKAYEISAIGLSDEFSAPKGKFRNIVLPLPFSRENGFVNAPLCEEKLPLALIEDYAAEDTVVFSGGSSAELLEICRRRGLKNIDYFDYEPLVMANAALTAEAAIAVIIKNTEFSLNGSDIVVTGGGRIAFFLARQLRAFGARVTICARNPSQRAKALSLCYNAEDILALPKLCESADVVVNTVPAPILKSEDFDKMAKDALFLELAGGKDSLYPNYAKQNGIRFSNAAGLPGLYSPKTAGEFIAKSILSHL